MVALRGETRTLNLEVWTVRRDDRRWNVESISVYMDRWKDCYQVPKGQSQLVTLISQLREVEIISQITGFLNYQESSYMYCIMAGKY